MIIVVTLVIIFGIVYLVARALTKYYTDNYPVIYETKTDNKKCN